MIGLRLAFIANPLGHSVQMLPFADTGRRNFMLD